MQSMPPAVYDELYADRIETTTRYLAQHISPRMEAGLTVLDLGSGTGAMLKQLAREFPGLRGIGVERSPSLVKYACRDAPEGINFLEGDLTDPDCHDAIRGLSVDIISMMFHVVNYFTELVVLRRLLEVCRPLLRPGGYVCFDAWGPEVVLYESYSRPLPSGGYVVTRRRRDREWVGSVCCEFAAVFPDEYNGYVECREEILMTPHSRSALELVARDAGYGIVQIREGLDGWDLLGTLSNPAQVAG